MSVHFEDFQDPANPLNGTEVHDLAGLIVLVSKLRGRPPFVFQLERADGARLDIGIGGSTGFAQFTGPGERAVAMVAVAPGGPASSGELEFLCGGTLTPIEGKYLLTRSLWEHIAGRFIERGDRSPDVAWEYE
jgi:hypothetical protein